MPYSRGIDHSWDRSWRDRGSRRASAWSIGIMGGLCVWLSGCWPSSSPLPPEASFSQAQRWLAKQPKASVAVLKKKVNWRSGPGPDHGVLWSYESPGWPVQILKKYDNWYWVQDALKTQGWVKGSMLSFTPGGVIVKRTILRSSPGGAQKAILLKGVLVLYKSVDDHWIYVTISNHQTKNRALKGWIRKDDVWPNPPHA